jgi:hypothetical protein
MARIRTIKPDFWTDETLGECSPTARLLFVGTWNLADDHGNLERSSRQLKAQLFPYDNFDCEPYVVELLHVGCLLEYEVDGKKYLHIKGFDRHQKVEKKSSPRHPLYEDSLRTHRVVTEPSPSSSGSSSSLRNGMEGKGREGIKEARGRFDATAVTGLDLPSWDRWLEYRSQRKPAIKPASMQAAAAELAAFGLQQSAVVQHSIANGYQGLFPPKTNGGLHVTTSAPLKLRTADEIEAEERARGDYDAQH